MKIDIIRAWKDEAYRNQLTEAELATVPANPAGPIELTDEQLTGAGGANMAGSSQAATVCSSFCVCPTKSIQCTIC